MTHEEFKALDEFDKFDVLEEMEVYMWGYIEAPADPEL
jgi:hypothetical protein